MFHNLLIYRIDKTNEAIDLQQALGLAAFLECTPSQEKSGGFEPPRGEEHGALVEHVGGQAIFKWTTETKTVPKQAIDKVLKQRVAEIEAATGRKPGKREKKEMKEDIRHQLMPQAFAKRSSTLGWIWAAAGLLVLDTASQRRADDIVTALCMRAEMSFTLLRSKAAPEGQMTAWLASEPPDDFTVDRSCELRASNGSDATVRYAKCSLNLPEIVERIEGGMTVPRLALTWDDRISFELNDTMRLRKLQYIGGGRPVGGKPADSFDADVALATGELQHFIPALLDVLGGIDTTLDLVGQAQQDASEDDEEEDEPTAPAPKAKRKPRAGGKKQ